MSSEFEAFNKHLTSSMKFTNFEGWSKDQIINKYEEWWFKREKQVQDWSFQIGKLNENYFTISEKIERIVKVNAEIRENWSRDEKKLSSERTNNDILFIKLNNWTHENDKIKEMIRTNCTDMSRLNNREGRRGRSVDVDNNRHNAVMKSKTMTQTILEANKKLTAEVGDIEKRKEMNNNVGIVKEDVKDVKEEKKRNDGKEEDVKEENTKNDNNIIRNESNNTTNIVVDGNERTNNIVGLNPQTKEKKIKKQRHKKDDKSKKPKRLASENIAYEPVFK